MKDPLPPDKSSSEREHTAATTGSVYAQWAKFVWLSLQRLGVRSADLDDVCHDVFIVVQRKLPEFDGRAKVQTWLFGICTRVAANYRRRAYIRYEDLTGGSDDEASLVVTAPESKRPDQVVERQRGVSLAEAILNRMSPVKRSVFVMFEVEGMSCPEIANELGLPVGTVYSRLHAARKLFLAESSRLRLAANQGKP